MLKILLNNTGTNLKIALMPPATPKLFFFRIVILYLFLYNLVILAARFSITISPLVFIRYLGSIKASAILIITNKDLYQLKLKNIVFIDYAMQKSARGLWLPSAVNLSDDDVRYVVSKIDEFFKKGDSSW